MTNEIIKVVRGFRDVYSNTDIKLLESFRIAISNITNQYGINELRTPILEKAELFNRSIGATTEIVNKEMYVFEDRNGDVLSLRPEGTASCVRSALENNLIFDRGIKRKKYWYFGPMFRRERPQKGRFRQFDQFGIEYFGFDNINSDLEIIFFGNRLFNDELKIDGIKLHINSIGNEEDRLIYGKKIKDLLDKYKKELTEDQQNTLDRNPIRILDNKSEKIKKILEDLPKLTDMLSTDSKKRFESLVQKLDQSNTKYIIDNSIVRGLDYYNDTVFEWKHDSLGSQDAICAGGRYDGLVKKIGGVEVPAIGFAAGVDRILMILSELNQTNLQSSSVAIINHSAENSYEALAKTEDLRNQFKQISFYSTDSSSNIDKQYKQAEQIKPKYILFFGDDEIKSNTYTIKGLKDKVKKEQISKTELAKILDNINK